MLSKIRLESDRLGQYFFGSSSNAAWGFKVREYFKRHVSYKCMCSSLTGQSHLTTDKTHWQKLKSLLILPHFESKRSLLLTTRLLVSCHIIVILLLLQPLERGDFWSSGFQSQSQIKKVIRSYFNCFYLKGVEFD